MSEKINERFEWITYKGKRILFGDYRHLDVDAFINQIKQNQRDLNEVMQREGQRDLLILTDLTGSTISKEVLQALKERTKEAQSFTKAQAVLGITGVRKFLFTVVQSLTSANVQAFDTYEEAKDWLVEQDDK
jgi:hypothetical protein